MALKVNDELIRAICNKIYPIGYIYISTEATNPGNIFGGSWEQIAQGRCLMGEGTVRANSDNWCGNTWWADWVAYAGTTGGEVKHTLGINEMPNHNHNVTVRAYYGGTSNTSDEYYNISSGWGTEWNNRPWLNYSEYVGGGASHNNLPPYLVVYMWKRIA